MSNYSVATRLLQEGKLDEAETICRKLVQARPADAESANLLGVIGLQKGRWTEAAAAFRLAVGAQPGHAGCHYNLATALHSQGLVEEAQASYRKALALAPSFSDAAVNLGILLLQQRQPGEALACFDLAVAARPAHAPSHFNRGNALRALARFSDSVASFQRALALRPDYVKAMTGLANSLADLEQWDAADAQYAAALRLAPNFPEAAWNRSLALLTQGRYADAWPGFEARFGCEALRPFVRQLAMPRWDGHADIAGRTLLLHCEQGLGDTLQFCRYVPLLASRGAQVVLEAEASLAPLLRALPGLHQLIEKGAELPAIDYHLPLLSAPLVFGTTLSTIPSPAQYLRAPPLRVQEWKTRLGERFAPRVGLVWSGNPAHANDAHRSIPLSKLLAHLPPGLDYVSLQPQVRESDRTALESANQVRRFEAELTDFAQTAALVECLDAVISVDTSVAHLAGALGKPTLVLLPTNSDWRWLRGQDDSPWYGSVRLVRQRVAGDWSSVLLELAARLSGLQGDER